VKVYVVSEFVPFGGPKAQWVFMDGPSAARKFLERKGDPACVSLVLSGPFESGDDLTDMLGPKLIEKHERSSMIPSTPRLGHVMSGF
jgi:hypothetical protein